jgi:hypothetical protein
VVVEHDAAGDGAQALPFSMPKYSYSPRRARRKNILNFLPFVFFVPSWLNFIGGQGTIPGTIESVMRY